MDISLSKDFTFEAAHRLPEVAPSHKCHRLHGHSFKVTVHMEGPIDEQKGWLVDFATISEAMAPLLSKVDHHFLNEIEGLSNPTSENLARWFWQGLHGRLPWLEAITIHETCNSRCHFRGNS